MVEQEKEVVEDGKRVKLKEMVYEYEAGMEDSYRTSLMKAFKKTITDGFFSFVVVDNVNDKVKYFGEMWSFAKQNGFQVILLCFVCFLQSQKFMKQFRFNLCSLVNFRSTFASWTWMCKYAPNAMFTIAPRKKLSSALMGGR